MQKHRDAFARISSWIGLVIGLGLINFAWWEFNPPLLAEQISKSVEVVAVILPKLTLFVEPETGERVDFGTLYSGPHESELSSPVRVSVRVISNLGSPYEVTQHLVIPLANEAGQPLPLDAMKMSALSSQPVTTSLSAAPQRLFVSDAQGRSQTEMVSYQLLVPPNQPAGTYRGTLLVTVTAQ